jgi:putative ABC transport system substrate-binding protein
MGRGRRALTLAGVLALALLAAALAAEAQPARIYRVGVVLLGGPYSLVVDGLREGLKELGFEEGNQFTFDVRDTKGDIKAVEAAARDMERASVELIYSVATSVTVATKRSTTRVPIVFYAGSDPVASGLVESFRKPGGRLTGVHGQSLDITAKRLELLKGIIPRLRRVVVFYNPLNPAAQQAMKFGREGARHLKLELVERQVASVEELRTGLRALRPGEVDAFLYVADGMVASQTDAIIETARVKRLPTMFSEPASVARGALASYGLSYQAFGRLSAKHVQRVLLGANPGDLPVEQLDRLHFVINLKTAKALGLTIPPSVLARADEVIQ